MPRIRWGNCPPIRNNQIQRNFSEPDFRIDLSVSTHASPRTTSIGTWNVRSVNGKELELVEEVRKYKIDILGVTETKKKGQGVDNLGSHTLIYSGVDINERARAGVALLLTNDIYKTSDFNFVSERLLEVNVQFKTKNIKMIVAYGPNEDAAKEDRDNFFEQLQRILDGTKPNQDIMILGDLNARVGNNHENYFGVIGKEGENSITPNGEMLLDFCIRNNLKIANTFFIHKNIHKWTRVSEERNEKSIIDYIIVSNNLFYNTNDVRVKRGAEIYSDHFLVVGKFNLEIQFTCKAKEVKHFKLKVENLKTEQNKIMYQNLIDIKLKEIEVKENEEDVEEIWSIYKAVLSDSASIACGNKLIGGQNKRTAWWNGDVKQKVREKCTVP